MNSTISAQTFARKIKICKMPMPSECAGWSSPQNGSVQPPKNSVTIMPDVATMLEYSARKNSANFIEPYSV